MKKIFIVTLALILSAHSIAQQSNCLWAKSAGGTSDDFGQSVSTDANGNVYMTGNFTSPTITFGSITLTNLSSPGSSDIFIAKYDAAGNVLWAKNAGGIYDDFCNSISTDANGNIYMSGYTFSPSIAFGLITLTNLNSALSGDIFIAKYDASGNVLWAKSAGGVNDDRGNSVSTDASGNVYMSGYFQSPTIIFGSTTLNNAGSPFGSSIFIVKYDGAGNVLWAKSAGGVNFDGGNSVSADVSGNVYLSGYFVSPTITFGSTLLTNAGGSNIFITKYNGNGNVLWAKSVGGTYNDYINSLSTDASGNVFMTGYFFNPTITFGSTTLINAGVANLFITKYDTAGNVLWANSAGGIYNDYGRSVSTDTSGNVYITGKFYSPTITFGLTTLTRTGNFDIFIAKYDAAGNVLWAKSVSGSNDDGGNCVSADGIGNVYVSGHYRSATINFGSTTLTNSDTTEIYTDIFIAKFDGTITSVDDLFDNKELKIYPNPTSNTITLTSPKPITTNIFITNLTGKQVATYNLQNTTAKTIDVSNLAEGVYFVTLKSDEGVVTKKIVKTH